MKNGQREKNYRQIQAHQRQQQPQLTAVPPTSRNVVVVSDELDMAVIDEDSSYDNQEDEVFVLTDPHQPFTSSLFTSCCFSIFSVCNPTKKISSDDDDDYQQKQQQHDCITASGGNDETTTSITAGITEDDDKIEDYHYVYHNNDYNNYGHRHRDEDEDEDHDHDSGNDDDKKDHYGEASIVDENMVDDAIAEEVREETTNEQAINETNIQQQRGEISIQRITNGVKNVVLDYE